MWDFLKKAKDNLLVTVLTIAIILLLGMNIYEKINNHVLSNTIDDLQSTLRAELTEQRNELGTGIDNLGELIAETGRIYQDIDGQLDRIEEGNSNIIVAVGGIEEGLLNSIQTVGRAGEIADTIQSNTQELERANSEAYDTIQRIKNRL